MNKEQLFAFFQQQDFPVLLRFPDATWIVISPFAAIPR
jgi:hypothetical protein